MNFPFTVDDIDVLLDVLSWTTVVGESERFPYRIVTKKGGYSQDPKIGKLQAILSVMRERAEVDA
jgi:hypothetical protein